MFLPLLLVPLLGSFPANGQQATTFVPSGLPAMFEGVTARLVYRQLGFVESWTDPTVQAAVLAGAFVRGQRTINLMCLKVQVKGGHMAYMQPDCF